MIKVADLVLFFVNDNSMLVVVGRKDTGFSQNFPDSFLILLVCWNNCVAVVHI